MRKKLTVLSFLGFFPALAQPPAGIPKTLKICAASCATLEWRNGRFEVMARDGQLATEYTVESFTPKSIVMKRTELSHSGDYGLTAIYKGTFADVPETAQGTVDFTWPDKPGYPHSAKWRAAWGGSIAEAKPPSQRRPEERGEQPALSAQQRQLRENVARWLILGAIFGAMSGDGDSTSSSGSGACTAGYWQSTPGGGQTWVCSAHGK